MIKYNAVQNKYLYKTEDIDRIIEMIKSNDSYYGNNCTQENISSFVKAVNDFLSNMQVVQENVEMKRNETEEEAREYFGESFISEFDQLLTELDSQETIVAIHGTLPEICSSICEEGLKYPQSALGSTAVQQKMNYGQQEMHYDSYENLLNWRHREYKGLVILAIPYECFYREGLWDHYQDTEAIGYSGQDYRINPEFIVGYIDVNNKKIVRNPKYSRQHDYSKNVYDTDIFREQPDMDNDRFKQALIESDKQFKEASFQGQRQSQQEEVYEEKEPQFDISRIPIIIEELIGTFNSIKNGFPAGMPEERYKMFLGELAQGFNDIAKQIPLLKTNEQVRKEQEEMEMMFQESSKTAQQSSQNSDFDSFGWDDDWGTPIEESEAKAK